MKSTYIKLSVSALLVFAATACTHTYRAPETLVSIPVASTKIPMAVELHLSDEFRNTKWKKKLMGDTFEIPVGRNLAQNSESVARHLFSTVIVSETAGAFNEQMDAILVPRVVAFEQAMGMMAWSEAVTTILLEWTLKDKDGNVLWVDTIKGEGRGPNGNAFTVRKQTEARVAAMIDNVFQKSFEAISNAKVIRDFHARQTAQNNPT